MSGLVTAYANQTIVWKHRSGPDRHGDAVYVTSSIKGRWESKHRLIRMPDGKEIASSGLCITEAAVEVDDMLTAPNGRVYVVLSVSIIPGLNGTELHREVMV